MHRGPRIDGRLLNVDALANCFADAKDFVVNTLPTLVGFLCLGRTPIAPVEDGACSGEGSAVFRTIGCHLYKRRQSFLDMVTRHLREHALVLLGRPVLVV